jgi:DNA primase
VTKGINENVDQPSAKYNILATFTVQGVVEVQDVVGALFGQTEGLLNDLELRELQKSGRIGRIVVNASSEAGVTKGEIIIPSSLDRTETAILAATLETVDRVGPCRASLKLEGIKDLRESKLKQIEERAKELLKGWKAETRDREDITEKINTQLEKESVITWNGLPAGAEIDVADQVIIVEGRNDIQQLFKIGVKNTVAVEGTRIPKPIIELTQKKECIAFLDGDRGGDMILNELLQVANVKYVARAPANKEVEELGPKDLVKALQMKKTVEEVLKDKRIKEDKDRRDRDGPNRSTQGKSYDSRGPRDKRSAPRQDSDRGQRGGRDDRRGPRNGDSQPRRPVITTNFPKAVTDSVKGLISSNQAIGYDENFNQIMTSTNVDIFSQLNDNVKTLVIDGVVTQRFLDKALNNKLKHIIAVNIAHNLKIDEAKSIELYYFKDFL